MATIGKEYDLRKCKKEHLGALLLGMFLETGLLTILFSAEERRHFEKIFGGKHPIDFVDQLVCSAAHNTGFSNVDIAEWSFTCHGYMVCIHDPHRVKLSQR